jgi:hypothetical protein
MAMHAALKLLTGLAATVVLSRAATMHQGASLMAQLGSAAAATFAAHGVADGSVSFRGPNRIVSRIARLSGTATPATRAAVIADLERHPGIQAAVWVQR